MPPTVSTWHGQDLALHTEIPADISVTWNTENLGQAHDLLCKQMIEHFKNVMRWVTNWLRLYLWYSLTFLSFPCLKNVRVIFQVFPNFQSKWEPWIAPYHFYLYKCPYFPEHQRPFQLILWLICGCVVIYLLCEFLKWQENQKLNHMRTCLTATFNPFLGNHSITKC